jgi:hypothetical protein
MNNKNKEGLTEVVNNFKKGHVKYELARSFRIIVDYIKKNKDNFTDLLLNIREEELKNVIITYDNNNQIDLSKSNKSLINLKITEKSLKDSHNQSQIVYMSKYK